MGQAGFKVLARSLCAGRAHCPIRWSGDVEVFGRRIVPGQLIHADKHGFLAIPPGDEPGLLEATRFMDAKECQTVIVAARDTACRSQIAFLDLRRWIGRAKRSARPCARNSETRNEVCSAFRVDVKFLQYESASRGRISQPQ
jgi:hypothetical protein